METDVTQDKIKEWKKEGWKFRIKNVKGKKYITRRKRKLERGLGRYHDELWSLIQNTSVGPSAIEQRLEAIKKVEVLLKGIRLHHITMHCAHSVEGFCHFWKYDKNPGFFNIVDARIGKGYYKQVTGDGPPFWVFRAVRFFCNNCPAYREK